MEQNFYEPQTELPNSTVVLVLGILSIVSCFCYGIPGLACAIVALVIARSSTKLYADNPDKYTEHSFSNLKVGKICAKVGLALFVFYLIAIILIVRLWLSWLLHYFKH
jgi:uncharacterized membrane protein